MRAVNAFMDFNIAQMGGEGGLSLCRAKSDGLAVLTQISAITSCRRDSAKRPIVSIPKVVIRRSLQTCACKSNQGNERGDFSE